MLHIKKVNLREHFASTVYLFWIRNILTFGAPISGLQTFALRIALSCHREVEPFETKLLNNLEMALRFTYVKQNPRKQKFETTEEFA